MSWLLLLPENTVYAPGETEFYFELWPQRLELSGSPIGDTGSMHRLSGSCSLPSCAVTFVDMLVIWGHTKVRSIFVRLPLDECRSIWGAGGERDTIKGVRNEEQGTFSN